MKSAKAADIGVAKQTDAGFTGQEDIQARKKRMSADAKRIVDDPRYAGAGQDKIHAERRAQNAIRKEIADQQKNIAQAKSDAKFAREIGQREQLLVNDHLRSVAEEIMQDGGSPMGEDNESHEELQADSMEQDATSPTSDYLDDESSCVPDGDSDDGSGDGSDDDDEYWFCIKCQWRRYVARPLKFVKDEFTCSKLGCVCYKDSRNIPSLRAPSMQSRRWGDRTRVPSTELNQNRNSASSKYDERERDDGAGHVDDSNREKKRGVVRRPRYNFVP
jgi:hypothetical protein